MEVWQPQRTTNASTNGRSRHRPGSPLSAILPTDVRDVRLLISAPVAAYVPVWYVREAVNNWLRFTLPSTHAVLHMDRARNASFSDDDFTADWLWLRGRTLRERVLINPLRIFTRRRSGALLAAHVHNFLFAQRTVATTHVLFLAHNSSLTNGSIVGRATIISLLSTNNTLSFPKMSGCPQARVWGLQTKYLVKRVAMDEADASQVRRLIASLPGAERM